MQAVQYDIHTALTDVINQC